MTHKLVAFSPSSDSNMRNITQQALDYVASIKDIEIEHVDESDPRLALYSRYPNRFPAYMLFKHNVMKTYIHAKLYPDQLLEWVINKSG
jgi:hypothetical protein